MTNKEQLEIFLDSPKYNNMYLIDTAQYRELFKNARDYTSKYLDDYTLESDLYELLIASGIIDNVQPIEDNNVQLIIKKDDFDIGCIKSLSEDAQAERIIKMLFEGRNPFSGLIEYTPKELKFFTDNKLRPSLEKIYDFNTQEPIIDTNTYNKIMQEINEYLAEQLCDYWEEQIEYDLYEDWNGFENFAAVVDNFSDFRKDSSIVTISLPIHSFMRAINSGSGEELLPNWDVLCTDINLLGEQIVRTLLQEVNLYNLSGSHNADWKNPDVIEQNEDEIEDIINKYI